MERMRRVHIVGGAGSGKTTLAQSLSERLGVPRYDLDLIGYEGGAGAKRELQSKRDDVQRIAALPGWVTEGIFLWWIEELFQQADLVVWLDVPFRVAAWRIFLRHVKREVARNNPHPGWRNLAFFLRNVRGYYRFGAIPPRAADDDAAVTRQTTMQILQTYGSKVVTCHRGSDIRRLTSSLLEIQERASGRS